MGEGSLPRTAGEALAWGIELVVQTFASGLELQVLCCFSCRAETGNGSYSWKLRDCSKAANQIETKICFIFMNKRGKKNI